jgi:hypothetical protein
VHFIDDVNFVAGPSGYVIHLLAEAPYLVDATVGSTIDLHHVQTLSGKDTKAILALIAGFAFTWSEAVYGPGKDSSHRGLSYPPLSGEEVSVG